MEPANSVSQFISSALTHCLLRDQKKQDDIVHFWVDCTLPVLTSDVFSKVLNNPTKTIFISPVNYEATWCTRVGAHLSWDYMPGGDTAYPSTPYYFTVSIDQISMSYLLEAANDSTRNKIVITLRLLGWGAWFSNRGLHFCEQHVLDMMCMEASCEHNNTGLDFCKFYGPIKSMPSLLPLEPITGCMSN